MKNSTLKNYNPETKSFNYIPEMTTAEKIGDKVYGFLYNNQAKGLVAFVVLVHIIGFGIYSLAKTV